MGNCAEIVDIGGLKAAPGETVSITEEIVPSSRNRDQCRHEIGELARRAGAGLLNDAWGGWDPKLASNAAKNDAVLVYTHAGGTERERDPLRVSYLDVIAEVITRTVAEAEREGEAINRRRGDRLYANTSQSVS